MFESDFSKIFRRKSRKELIVLSSIVCGIEFCYSAETAFVTPTLLTAGVRADSTSVIWSVSPLIGFFLSPVLGSLSDACVWSLGRRRPFILLYSFGIIIGLILVPNSQFISRLFTDDCHSMNIFLTILGAVLLDFSCDACQSPSRALLCEVTLKEDHALGLSTFTSMAGLGGAVGYLIGGLDWEDLPLVRYALGSDHKKIVFLFCAIAFTVCVVLTITSFQEIPLYMIESDDLKSDLKTDFKYHQITDPKPDESYEMTSLYSGSKRFQLSHMDSIALTANSSATFVDYLYSIVRMPVRLRTLCLTNLFSWMSLICYSLYFTDFVAESIFGGDPTALIGSESLDLYESGVRFGCLCMTFYSISCSVYSFYFRSLVNCLGMYWIEVKETDCPLSQRREGVVRRKWFDIRGRNAGHRSHPQPRQCSPLLSQRWHSILDSLHNAVHFDRQIPVE